MMKQKIQMRTKKITIKKTNDRQKFRKHASDIIENLLYDNRDAICKI